MMTKQTPLITYGYNHLEPGHPDNPKNYRICGTKTKGLGSNLACTHPAGWGTSHPGVGRCKLHGGCSLAGADHGKWKGGRYAHVMKGRLKEYFKAIDQDETNPLDLLPELEMQRVMLSIALDKLSGAAVQPAARQDEVEELTTNLGNVEDVGDDDVDADVDMVGGGGGMALHDVMVPMDIPRIEFSSSGIQKPMPKNEMLLVRVEDLDIARQCAMDVIQTVAKIQTMRNQTALTKMEVVYLMSTLKEAINLYVPKDNQEAFVKFLLNKMPIEVADETEAND